MDMLFGHLADYATTDHRGKLILVGIFNVVHTRPAERLEMPPATIVAAFRASVLEGATHRLEVRVTDADGADIPAFPRQQVTIPFVHEIGDRTLYANLVMPIAGLWFPTFGEYAFRFYGGERQLGEIALQLVPIAASDAPAG